MFFPNSGCSYRIGDVGHGKQMSPDYVQALIVWRLPLESFFQDDQSGCGRGKVAMGVSSPSDVFHQPNVPGTKNMFRAVAKSYFHLTPQVDD